MTTGAKRTLAALAFACVCTIALAAQAEVTLRAQSALPKSLIYTKSFLENFVKPLNERGKGVVQIQFLGGPEITPPRKTAAALQRGVIDVLYSPTGYYVGTLPEAYALMLSTKEAPEARENGTYEILDKLYAERLNAHLIAWGESKGQYNLYFVKEPKITAEGIDLTGMKMRSTGVFRSIIEGLGGTPVEIKTSEIYTALQRGVVDGFGFPEVGLTSIGVSKLVKYRIDPAFYRFTTLVIVNLDKWNSLPREARQLLTDIGKEYEVASSKDVADASAAEVAEMKKNRMEIITLTGAARDNYLEIANKEMWERLNSKVAAETVQALRKKLVD